MNTWKKVARFFSDQNFKSDQGSDWPASKNFEGTVGGWEVGGWDCQLLSPCTPGNMIWDDPRGVFTPFKPTYPCGQSRTKPLPMFISTQRYRLWEFLGEWNWHIDEDNGVFGSELQCDDVGRDECSIHSHTALVTSGSVTIPWGIASWSKNIF